MADVTWRRCTGQVWCRLMNLRLHSVRGSGVYVIWAGDTWVYVGQGDIASSLRSHKTEDTILSYENRGTLMVTWATVPPNQLDGIERYLGYALRPAVEKQYPIAPPIPVNLPTV